MDKPKKLSLDEIRKVLVDNRRARRTAESATFDENTRRIVLAALDFQETAELQLINAPVSPHDLRSALAIVRSGSDARRIHWTCLSHVPLGANHYREFLVLAALVNQRGRIVKLATEEL